MSGAHHYRNHLIERAVALIDLLNSPGWHSPGEAAQVMGCTEKTVYRWLDVIEVLMPLEVDGPGNRRNRFRLMRREKNGV